MTASLATTNGSALSKYAPEWTPEEKKLVKSLIAPGCTDDELRLFAAQCQRTALDPFTRQIYAIKRDQWNPATRQKEGKMTIQISIDGLRIIAQRSSLYDGQDGPWWCGADGVWKEVWLGDELPSAAKVVVYRKDFSRPMVGIAIFSEFAATKSDGTLLGLWKKTEKPALMLAKCAEALAFRKAFPNDLSGLYTAEEMSRAGDSIEVKVVEETPVPAPALPATVKLVDRTEERAGIDTLAAKDVPPVPPAPPVRPVPTPAEPEPEPAAVSTPAPKPEAPAATGAEAILRSRVNSLSVTGRRALLAGYATVKGFEEIKTIDAWLELAEQKAPAHLAGLTVEAIARLNEGKHPRSGEQLVAKPGRKAQPKQAEATEAKSGSDPADPMGDE